MSLSKLPVEVREDFIFVYLERNDLLRLRSASKESRDLVNAYLKRPLVVEKAPEVAVGLKRTDAYPTFHAFSEMDIPTTKIYVKNSTNGHGFKRGPRNGIPHFLDTYAAGVKHLHLECFSIYVHQNRLDEVQFYGAFPNLETLRVDKFKICRPSAEYIPVLPTSFRKLKSIDLNVSSHNFRYCPEIWISEDPWANLSLTYWLNNYPSLEKFRLTMHSWRGLDFGNFVVTLLKAAIEERRAQDPQWKSIEFCVDKFWMRGTPMLYQLLDNCTSRGISVAGIHSEWLVDTEWWINRHPHLLQEDPLRVPSSITALQFDVPTTGQLIWNMDFAKVQSLEITSATGFLRAFNRQLEQGHFPLPTWTTSLTTLLLKLDTDFWWDDGRFFGLFTLLFGVCGDVPLNTLKEVVLELPSIRLDNSGIMFARLGDLLAYFAPNLKKLTLINWYNESNVLAGLWPEIPQLEELKLKNCRGLIDASFIGRNNGNPAFLALHNLRKLSLDNKLTFERNLDNFFASVLPRMSLTHFSMTISEELAGQKLVGWLQSIPRESAFAGSIREIKVNDCPLHKMKSHNELQQTGEGFRSSQML